MRKRHMAEALAAGSALVHEERAQLALEGQLHLDSTEDILEIVETPINDEVKELTKQNPALMEALDRVEELEGQLRALTGAQQAPGWTEDSSQEHKRSAQEVQGMLAARNGSKHTGLSQTDRRRLGVALALLQVSQERTDVMQKMLKTLPASMEGAVSETALSIQSDLSHEEIVNAALAQKLQAIMERNEDGAISEGHILILRDLAGQLEKEQEQAEMRQAQLVWLQAEAKRVRVAELIEARDKLEQLHERAVATSGLVLPFTPVASAEDAESIAVDWMQPISGEAVRYHLQWRAHGESCWTSSEASEHVQVPYCTKGGLSSDTKYEFRVRAANSLGMWGTWSNPTEPTGPNPSLHAVPSRPKMRNTSKGGVQARWSAPQLKAGSKLTGYELQWRRCDGAWEEPDSSMEANDNVAVITALQPHVFYVFRVRASVNFSYWTDFGPSSAPLQVSKRKGESQEDTPAPASTAAMQLVPILRKHSADDSETVIAEDIREMARSTNDPHLQAAADESLSQLSKKKQEDATNLHILEERHKSLVTEGREVKLMELSSLNPNSNKKARELQLDNLVALKQKKLANGEAKEGSNEPTRSAIDTDTWD
mmetsp:Transcript_83329/g.166349  ORF Transcript_83329/g.166349 Transcript_83329/m.166349 type:complete len:599 (+) Transcript_83329:1803-3599(+)